MSVTHLPNTHYTGLVLDQKKQLLGEGFDWLANLRKQAAEQFSASGFPTFREEEWRYTNITPIEKNQFTLPDVAGQVDSAFVDSVLLDDCHHIVFVDGFYQAELSSLKDIPNGVIVSALSDGLVDNEALIKSLLDSVVETPALGFINFNTALFSDGALICIEENTVVDKPIQVAFISSKQGALTLSNTRNLILAQASSKAQIIETYHAVDDSCYLTNVVSEVVVEPNANLSHHRLQSESTSAYHIGGVYSRLEKNAIFNQNSYTFGASISRTEAHATLGEASDCTMDGLYVGQDRQHMDQHTRLNHAQPHAVSNEFYKGILGDHSTGVFQGRIIVAQDAQKTDAAMNNRNLLLSDRAEVDTKPQLEIYADDVKCAHGVTVGQLDDAAVFYLQSRGVDNQTAKNMLTFAFANEMIERVSFEPLRMALLANLLKRFPQAGMKKEWL
ncbi:MAG: Fe-S cluster assembly protein SufD [Cycloclasticus pugetii]|jgi:Fe-S cluster assembly protein SufD|uniref:Fe-S cluster assembly protein SufD n=1 Tax=Cycloclasticus zancles 78-ME TaxID=1198232 RepID=S5TGA2_9GAMM|nr:MULTISPECIES: Fe-S cluster assembly protein SufD [Cycloclasticus]AGS39872.1 Fe-S cluster assembly protein SufD [Cycloclasticus zancles 78-ME]MBV1897932.1 Fe-S cluster assembly protein SufD [Cycloclasticus sp.]